MSGEEHADWLKDEARTLPDVIDSGNFEMPSSTQAHVNLTEIHQNLMNNKANDDEFKIEEKEMEVPEDILRRLAKNSARNVQRKSTTVMLKALTKTAKSTYEKETITEPDIVKIMENLREQLHDYVKTNSKMKSEIRELTHTAEVKAEVIRGLEGEVKGLQSVMIKHKSEKERISKLYEHKKGEFNTLKYAHEKA